MDGSTLIEHAKNSLNLQATLSPEFPQIHIHPNNRHVFAQTAHGLELKRMLSRALNE
jgi:hypothetical protein